jgi:riboflavin biosynthesis pyrimidine reductase
VTLGDGGSQRAAGATTQAAAGAQIADADEVVEQLRFADCASNARPFVAVNMVTTVDGRASVAGRTAPLSSVADRQFFHALRTRVDAVLMGAGTLRTERYGRLVRAAHRRDRRVANGLTSDPLAIVVNGSLDLPGTLPLLQDSASRVRARLVSRVVCRDGDDSLCQPLHRP